MAAAATGTTPAAGSLGQIADDEQAIAAIDAMLDEQEAALSEPLQPPRDSEMNRDKPTATTGIVKWFNPTKGFGFVQPENDGPDVFVHVSAVLRAGLNDLQEGQRVSFELVLSSASARAG